jgi:hypothetical protein
VTESIIVLALILGAAVGLWILTGRMEDMATLDDEPCSHLDTDYSYTLGTTRCMSCGAVVDQETWD